MYMRFEWEGGVVIKESVVIHGKGKYSIYLEYIPHEKMGDAVSRVYIRSIHIIPLHI